MKLEWGIRAIMYQILQDSRISSLSPQPRRKVLPRSTGGFHGISHKRLRSGYVISNSVEKRRDLGRSHRLPRSLLGPHRPHLYAPQCTIILQPLPPSSPHHARIIPSSRCLPQLPIHLFYGGNKRSRVPYDYRLRHRSSDRVSKKKKKKEKNVKRGKFYDRKKITHNILKQDIILFSDYGKFK